MAACLKQDKHIPALSVVMPTFNAAQYIVGAVNSVLNQTFTDFELLIIDDGSTDNTAEILNKFKVDKRVRIIRNDKNKGLIETLHQGYELSRSPFIARMDADDICNKQRFKLQLDFLKANSEIGIVGGSIRFFGNVIPHTFQFPGNHKSIWPAMLFYCPLAHPAIIFRRELVDKGLMRYDSAFTHAEDYHLWSKLLQKVKVANVHEVVLNYRLHDKQVSSDSSSKQYAASVEVRKQMLIESGVSPTDVEITLHESILRECPLSKPDYLEKVAQWFNRIEKTNIKSKYWDPFELHVLLKSKFIDTAELTEADVGHLVNGEYARYYVTTKEMRNIFINRFKKELILKIKNRIRPIAKTFLKGY